MGGRKEKEAMTLQLRVGGKYQPRDPKAEPVTIVGDNFRGFQGFVGSNALVYHKEGVALFTPFGSKTDLIHEITEQPMKTTKCVSGGKIGSYAIPIDHPSLSTFNTGGTTGPDPDHDLALRGAELVRDKAWLKLREFHPTAVLFDDRMAEFQRARTYWLKVKGDKP